MRWIPLPFFFGGSELGFLAAMLLEGGAIQLFQLFFHILLVGGFNPFEKYESNWVIISSQVVVKIKKNIWWNLKPPASWLSLIFIIAGGVPQLHPLVNKGTTYIISCDCSGGGAARFEWTSSGRYGRLKTTWVWCSISRSRGILWVFETCNCWFWMCPLFLLQPLWFLAISAC